ncbi:hypothetical protein [Alkalicoccobacillus porphyridii]|uniref:Uncharacterized protein n=1 Tax=Alkalicoccobacillus porphyridii TaxID=2597270 RepID=A0A553ZVU2_9BACI|nr:hypothetical protein [Alkalicoccobacillus porphyridii]TSB45552.1 hypothetical protein FN960_15390 [Alkalicoccobacillus porphyridii]
MHTLLHIVLPILGSALFFLAIITQSVPILILFLCLAIPLITRHFYIRIRQGQKVFALLIVVIVILTIYVSYPFFT